MPGPAVMRFAGIRGHDAVAAALRREAAAERLAHGLLFAGPEGIGKRAVALALAAWLQCEAPSADDACGECAACRQVAAGTHPDVQLVTAPAGKKDIGVDRVRELRRLVGLRPVRERARVVIVDDAPVMTVAAQNALLKTLEEPPPASFIILVAANADALLPTIRSRARRVRFAPLGPEEVVDVLVHAHGLAPPAARALARLAEGSVGRALQLHRALGDPGEAAGAAMLVALERPRYCDAVSAIREWSTPETATVLRLEVLLAALRDEAVRLAGTEDPTADAVLRRILRRADLVREAVAALRRGSANRQLVLDRLFIRLTEV